MEETDKLLNKGEESEKDDEKKVISYKLDNFRFLDGLRGIAALGVFFNNVFDEFFHLETADERDHPDEEKGGVTRPPDYFRDTPVKIIYQGTLWVALFFIISGFVLTLRFF
jgi:peptidoglycan/LPS O-acetylase OafA/YrhL